MERGFYRNRGGESICRSNLGGTRSISSCSSCFGFPQTPPCCRQHYQTPHPHYIPGILRQIFCFLLVTKVIRLHYLSEAFTFFGKTPFPLLFLECFISLGVEGHFQEKRLLKKTDFVATTDPIRDFSRPTFPLPASLNPLD